MAGCATIAAVRVSRASPPGRSSNSAPSGPARRWTKPWTPWRRPAGSKWWPTARNAWWPSIRRCWRPPHERPLEVRQRGPATRWSCRRRAGSPVSPLGSATPNCSNCSNCSCSRRCRFRPSDRWKHPPKAPLLQLQLLHLLQLGRQPGLSEGSCDLLPETPGTPETPPSGTANATLSVSVQAPLPAADPPPPPAPAPVRPWSAADWRLFHNDRQLAAEVALGKTRAAGSDLRLHLLHQGMVPGAARVIGGPGHRCPGGCWASPTHRHRHPRPGTRRPSWSTCRRPGPKTTCRRVRQHAGAGIAGRRRRHRLH